MIDLFRRLFAPVIVGSIICTGLLFGWTMMQDGRPPYLEDMARVWPFMMLFVGLGYLLLVPIALAMFKWVEQQWLRPLLVALAGALIGIILILPISISPGFTFPEALFPPSCGALGALTWYAFNRKFYGAKS